jgi:hypothetical protein
MEDVQGLLLGTDVAPADLLLKTGLVEREPRLVQGGGFRMFSLSR